MKIFVSIFYSLLLLFIALFFATPHALAADAWYDTAWTKRIKITFNNADQAENLTNFPVLVTLSSSNISYASTQNTGQDIRFTDSDGTTLLSYEIEKWDESGSSSVWVKVPQIDASSSTDYMYMYYGNTSASDAQNKTAVWSTYAAVYHLSETGSGTSGEYKDSSANAFNGTGGAGTAANVPTVQTSGKIGNAQNFDGTDFVDMGNVLSFTDSFTLSSWIYCANNSTTGVIIGKRNSNDNTGSQYVMLFAPGTCTTTLRFLLRTSNPTANNVRDSASSFTVGAWYNVVSVFNYTAQTMSIYVNGALNNGVLINGSSFITINPSVLPVRIGTDAVGNAGRFFTGYIDETRVSSDAKSAAWIAATYKSESGSFNTYASPETAVVATPTVTPPSPAELDAPADKSYTNNERPTFRWKTSPDSVSSLSKYVFEVDNPSVGTGQPGGDFTIDDIPVSSTSDIDTNKYLIRYENFSDADTTNNYISVHTKSSTEWTTEQNDGKLREGVVNWKVKTRGTNGGESTASRTLFVDRTGPNATFTQINSTPINTSLFSTSDNTPTIFGKITDPLAGGDSTLTQTKYGPRVASGPKQAEIKIEKREGTYYTIHTLYTLQLHSSQFTCDGKEITDNTDQSCDKYAPFEYTTAVPLDPGMYRVTLVGQDTVDNESSETSMLLTIGATSLSTAPAEPTQEITQALPTPIPTVAVEEPVEPVSVAPNILDALFRFLTTIINWAEQTALIAYANMLHVVNQTLASIGNGYQRLSDTAPGVIKFVLNGIGSGFMMCRDISAVFAHSIQLAFTSLDSWVTTIAMQIMPTVKFALANIHNTLELITMTYAHFSNAELSMKHQLSLFVSDTFTLFADSIGNRYVALEQHSTGITKTILIGIADGFVDTTTAVSKFISDTSRSISLATTQTLTTATTGINNANKNLSHQISSAAFALGEKTQDVSDTAGYAIINFTYNFVSEPTTISDVAAIALSPTSAKVTWKTNHPANGKVNWGLEDGIYTFENQTNKRTTHHEFILTNLTPGTEYNYEVMSHNKNYVYDANRKFHTPVEE